MGPLTVVYKVQAEHTHDCPCAVMLCTVFAVFVEVSHSVKLVSFTPGAHALLTPTSLPSSPKGVV